jgi:hypothetical protein
MTRNHTALLSALASIALMSADTQAQHSHGGHNHGSEATIKTEVLPNENHAAGQTAATVIRLTGPNGKPVTLNDLKEAHTEKLHLLIVDESLTDYHHEHPAPGEKPGEYRFDFKPKFGGTYHVWADLLPVASGKQEYSKTTLTVRGEPGKPQNTANTTAEVDGHMFTWSTEGDKPLRVGESALVKINVRGPDGKPFKQLEPVMGAYAHMVAFPTNLESVTHVHPSGPEPTKKTERGGPDLSFHVVPEQAASRSSTCKRRSAGATSSSHWRRHCRGVSRHRGCRCDAHLPDASRGAAKGARQMPEVRRHGARA